MWEEESIPDHSFVFSRVYKNEVSRQDGNPKATAFQNTPHKGGVDLSCDWDQYATAQSSRELIGKQRKKDGTNKNMYDYFIWSFSVQKIREIDNPAQNVLHRPIYNSPELEELPNNRAHSGIFGEKPVNEAKFRVKLIECGSWAVPPNSDSSQNEQQDTPKQN